MSSVAPKLSSDDNGDPQSPPATAPARNALRRPDQRSSKSSLLYGLAAAAVLSAGMLRWSLEPWISGTPPFIFFIAPVVVSAWYGGMKPGIFATVLSAFAGWYFFVPPQLAIFKGNLDIAARLTLFVLAGSAISSLCARLRETQEEGRQSEARFRSTFENAAVGMAHIEPDGRFARVNGRLAQILGYTPEEMTGASVLELIAADMESPHYHPFRQLISGDQASYSGEHRLRRADGSLVWVNLTLSLERDDQRQPQYVIAIVEDITARRRAEDGLRVNLQQLQATFDGMVEPAILTAVTGDILAVNFAWLSLFDLKTRPRVRSDWFECFEFTTPDGSPMRSDRSPFFRTLAGDVVRDMEVTGRQKTTGRVFHLILGTSPVRDEEGNIVAVIGTAHDITERKRAEEELKRSNSVLRQFAYAAAHDLQEPLRNVALASELVSRKYREQLDADGRELLATSVDGAKRMHRMVRDLLDYTKVIDAGELDTSACDAGQALQDALANLKDALQESGAAVSSDTLPRVRFRETHMVQVFQNLISNSLKYRRHDVSPSIHISVEGRGSDYIFSVTDNGIGFEPSHAVRIFGLFRRLHVHSEYPGTGIGLAICARIVEHYGGRIWAEGNPGSGAVFRFQAPADPSEPAADEATVVS